MNTPQPLPCFFSSRAFAVTGGLFGAGEGPIFMDRVNCVGGETHLATCSFPGFDHHACSHDHDAGVLCMPRESAGHTWSSSHTLIHGVLHTAMYSVTHTLTHGVLYIAMYSVTHTLIHGVLYTIHYLSL